MFCSVCVASVPPFEHQRVRCLLCCGPVKSPDTATGLIQHLHRSTQALKQHCSDCQMLVCKVKHTLKVMISVHGVKSRPCCHTKALVIIRHNTIYWKCDSKLGNMGLGEFFGGQLFSNKKHKTELSSLKWWGSWAGLSGSKVKTFKRAQLLIEGHVWKLFNQEYHMSFLQRGWVRQEK